MDILEIILLIGAIIFSIVSTFGPIFLIVFFDTRFVLKYFHILINQANNIQTTARNADRIKKLILPSWERFFRVATQILLFPLLVATTLVFALEELNDGIIIVLLGWLVHLVISLMLTNQANDILHKGGGIRADKIHVSKDIYDITYNERTESIHLSPQIRTDRSLMNYLYFFTGMISNTLCPIALYFGKKKALKKHNIHNNASEEQAS